MSSVDRLIEYYFQRKIAGMSEDEIRSSLLEHVMEENEREVIFNQVCYKELLYLKSLAQKKVGRILIICGAIILLAASSLFIYLQFNEPFEYSNYFVYGLSSMGFIGLLGGLLLHRN